MIVYVSEIDLIFTEALNNTSLYYQSSINEKCDFRFSPQFNQLRD